MRLLIDVPEVPEGSKTCGECPEGVTNFCFRFEVGLGGKNRCSPCRKAEQAALKLLRIKAEKDEKEKTWK